MLREAHNRLFGRTKMLHLRLRKTVVGKEGTKRFERDGFAAAHLNERSPSEFDREVETAHDEACDRNQKERDRDHVEEERMAHEGDVCAGAKKFHGTVPLTDPNT